ncbi:hypothetical protein EZV73_03890 [Acidaminobacter sp. JC074]|uniref:hypothetical protein n=1 Tax=Acidaminobacter sp. JC074 TaxID=2530199 RepID=UPI001F10C5B1|nr:hypothetical protein [Acidaminobacter sp. JC074]MCH4886692.1 hypothetical protein [Acidaminobacter sp. JC074]
MEIVHQKRIKKPLIICVVIAAFVLIINYASHFYNVNSMVDQINEGDYSLMKVDVMVNNSNVNSHRIKEQKTIDSIRKRLNFNWNIVKKEGTHTTGYRGDATGVVYHFIFDKEIIKLELYIDNYLRISKSSDHHYECYLLKTSWKNKNDFIYLLNLQNLIKQSVRVE